MSPGENEKIFKIIKFRTMNFFKNKNGELLPDKNRLTSIGKFIRKYSLDEIPEPFNVLIRGMMLIGPRPLIIEYLSIHNDAQKKSHNVQPEIIGWIQENGRSSITCLKNFRKVLQKKYVNLNKELSSEHFNGKN